MFETSVLYEANYNATAQVVVDQGGTSSGKTYNILQVLFTKLSERPRKVCTVVGQDIPNLKAGALRDALEIFDNTPTLRRLIKSYNKSDRIFTYHNGSIMEFKSYDGPQDAKSGKRDYLFVNEANGVEYLIWKELFLRTRIQSYIDYNPNAEFWVHEHLIGKPFVQTFISDHRHNPFLSDMQRATIEALRDEDEELWRVYARGLTGKIEGLVLRNWSLCDEIPADAKHVGTGMDFGFTNDPTGVVDVYMQNGELWLDELMYDYGLTNPAICKRLDEAGFNRRHDIIADSAEPKSIREIKDQGFRIEGAVKGPDSILNGIDILKRYHLNVTKRSTNLRKELNNYKWKVDKTTGKATNEPVDVFNHLIDPLRYVALNKIGKQQARPAYLRRLN
ncbi:PBSX family phage terminase large subunit [Rufibacter quisquiliarum]|uniref:Phage terminase large subunit n=1 Tax=Rufibacter quisquiliarum TaxID=1549639 RepID=A0A839GX58_9BACT|nr:terminase large subunit [Rufibacter quisquiliarum]MBA9078311.1 phage terminase large subunit [Rufibacter quisquiliarum]